MATTRAAPAEPRVRFRKPRLFAWKTLVLFVTTIALVPILLYKSEMAARLYIVYLIVIHIVGLVTFAYGVKREDIAPTRRGLHGRLAGLAFAIGLLFLAEKGLRTDTGGTIFWWSLFGIWAIHTAGLALLHLRGSKEDQACPFA
jgi:hypothetical protein